MGLAVGLAFALVGRAVVGCANFAAVGYARGCGLMRGLGLLVGWMAVLTVARRGLGVLVGMSHLCCGARLGVVWAAWRNVHGVCGAAVKGS